MELKRVTNLLSKRLRSTVIVGVVVAMLLSMMPAFSSPAAAWSQPDPRWIEEYNWWNWRSGCHIRQSRSAVTAVHYTVFFDEGIGDWVSQDLHRHRDHLYRGQLWADDYPVAWAEAAEKLEERVVTWGALRDAAAQAQAEGVTLPRWFRWLVNSFDDLEQDGRLSADAAAQVSQELAEWLVVNEGIARGRLREDVRPSNLLIFWGDEEARDARDRLTGMLVGIKHADYSLYHLWASDDWFDDLLLQGVCQDFCDLLGWEAGNNAVSRAQFWYERALEAYEEHGLLEFPDRYSDPGVLDKTHFVYNYNVKGERLITAYDYLGRALHYVQDLTCPAHSAGLVRHMPEELEAYEGWSGAQGPDGHPSEWEAWTDWPEGAEGEDFATEAYNRIAPAMAAWQGQGGGTWEGAESRRDPDRRLAEHTRQFLRDSIEVGAGMLIRFHEQVAEEKDVPESNYLTINIMGQGSGEPFGEGVHPIEPGTEPEVTAVPAEGWEFVEWTGAVESTNETISLTMDEDKDITAVFGIVGKFSVGDTVTTTARLNVREEPGLGTNIIRTQPWATAGVIIPAQEPYPRYLDGYTWWHIEYDDGTIGWSADDWLQEYTRPAPKFSVGQSVVTTDELYVRSEPRLTDESGIYFTDNVDKTQPGGTKGVISDFEAPKARVIMGYNLWKIEYEDGTVGWSSDHRLMQAGTFVPVDLVLVLDRSGSMDWSMGPGTRMEGAKKAATSVIDMLMPEDRVAVVSFAADATTDVELTGDFEHAKAEIQNIVAWGGTSFGAGMKQAVEELEERGSEDHARVIVFMSDGIHNRDPDPEPYVEECADLGIPIYTVGFADSPEEVGEESLKWMAEETGGEYFFADDLYDLENVFLSFTLEATGWPLAAEFSGVVAEGETVVAGNFTIESGTEYARVTLNWPGSDLDLVIERPDGSMMYLGMGPDNIYSGYEAKPEWAILLAPEPGTWTVKVYGVVVNSQIPFNVWVSTYVDPLKEEPDRPIPPVGGTAYPIDTLALLAPWIALAAIMAGAGLLVLRRRRA